MEMFRLPLRIVIALWWIRRLQVPGSFYVKAIPYYEKQLEFLTDACRITDPEHEVGWFERLLRNMVNAYRRRLAKDAAQLIELNVGGIGFIKKGDK